MDHQSSAALQQFKNLVGLKFQLYNSLFTSLPFHRIEKTGVLLSLFLLQCEEGFSKNQSPAQIIEKFLQQKIFLQLFIKVKPKWRDNDFQLKEYGY